MIYVGIDIAKITHYAVVMADDGELKIRVYAMVDSEDPDFAAQLAEYRTVGDGDDGGCPQRR